MKNCPHKIDWWIVIVSTIILLFSTTPNWVGYQFQTDELTYKGIFFDAHDYAVHISMLRAGMQGDWAYQFRFTTEPHQAAYTRTFYLVLGQVNRLFRLDPALIFESARWICGYLALFAIYVLAKRILDNPFWQRVGFLLAVFGSGLGWLQLIMNWVPGSITPIDFWFIDAYVFFGLALFPHFSLVTAALCFVLVLYLDYLTTSSWKYIFGIAIVAIVTQFVNPIAFILIDTSLTTITLTVWYQNRKADWQQFASLALIGLAQLPLLIYNFNLLTRDPLWSQFTRQNETLSPPPIYYLWGFGLLLVLVLLGLGYTIRERKPVLFGMAAWIFTGAILAYAPFAIQRRFLHGATIPLGFLAAYGLARLTQIPSPTINWLSRKKTSIAIIVIFLASISNLYLILGHSLSLQSHPDDEYYPSVLNPAFSWLQENAKPDDFVLSAAPSGLLIPQMTDLRVYFAHQMETLHHDAKAQLVTEFFQGKAAPGWLESTQVNWIFYGPYERDLTGESTFPVENLDVAYRSPEIIIYQVKK